MCICISLKFTCLNKNSSSKYFVIIYVILGLLSEIKQYSGICKYVYLIIINTRIYRFYITIKQVHLTLLWAILCKLLDPLPFDNYDTRTRHYGHHSKFIQSLVVLLFVREPGSKNSRFLVRARCIISMNECGKKNFKQHCKTTARLSWRYCLYVI